jgi:hypothetical protein
LRINHKIDMVAIVQFAQEKHRESDTGVISDWYEDELSKPVRVEFHRVLRDLRMLPAARWCRPGYSFLSSLGVGEVRFKREDRAWRPLGFFLPSEIVRQLTGIPPSENGEVFVLLIGAYKKQGSRRGREHDHWTPRDAQEIAIKRRDHVLATGRTAIHAYSF